MRFHARVAVGSPALRLAALSALLLVLLVGSGALVAGAASLLPSPRIDRGPVTPSWRSVRPTAVIDVPNAAGVIALTTDGTDVWATGADQLVRIDGATNAAQYLAAPVSSDDSALLYADDGLWTTSYSRDKLYRLDPTTGAVGLSVDVLTPGGPHLDGDQLWVDTGSGMIQVDRVTGAKGDSRPCGWYTTAGPTGPASVWSWIPGAPQTVKRVDMATGDTIANIEVPMAPGCASAGLQGSFPQAFFAGCYFAGEVADRQFTRIDPTTDTIATTTVLPATHGAAPAIVDGQVWFAGSFQADDGTAFGGLVRVDPTTGEVEQWVSIGDVDPDPPLVADGAIWVGDDGGQRVLRFDLADLARQ